MRLSELPSETLTLVMRKLPLTCRLGTSTCSALVSTQFLEAAVSATSTLALEEGQCADTDNLQLWLKNRGQGVEKLQVAGAPGPVFIIPCPKLDVLIIHDSTVDLGPGSQLFQDLTAATQLTGLSFRRVVFQDEPDFHKLLQALPNLQQLELVQLQFTGNPLADPLARFVSGQENPHNRYRRFTDDGMQLLSQFTKLNHLDLHTVRDVTAAGIENLCSLPALSSVSLQGLTCSITPSTVPSISKWTSLKTLCLSFVCSSAVVDLDILAAMTQLSGLHLIHVNRQEGAAGAEKLLSVIGNLGRLHQLVTLEITQKDALWQCQPESFAALTASSKLENLILDFCTTSWPIKTSTAWEHVFAPGRQLSELRCLRIEGAFRCTSADVERITRCCPGLYELHICTKTIQEAPCTQMAALSSLSSLSSLSICGVTDIMAPALAQLSCLGKLKDLCLKDISGYDEEHLTSAGLQQLTALTQLSTLKFCAMFHLDLAICKIVSSFKYNVSPAGVTYAVRNKARCGSPPDVWSQLAACFE